MAAWNEIPHFKWFKYVWKPWLSLWFKRPVQHRWYVMYCKDDCIAEFRFQKRHILSWERCYRFLLSWSATRDQQSLDREDSTCSWKDWLILVDIQILFIVLVDHYLSYAWLPTKYIYDTHRRKINNWNNGILNRAALQMYADAISAKGPALDNCFGFIEGTVKPFYKPGKW